MGGTAGKGVQVWWADPSDIPDGALVPELSAEERVRHDRFRFAPDRHIYAVAHALVRRVLSRHLGGAPSRWTFVENPHGRPEITPGLDPTDLRFNLSHTEGLVAVATCEGRELGVDVEHQFPRSFDLGVAEHFFAAAEVRELRTRPASLQRARFFDYWTLKEAYIKARGLGLALPLDQFAFQVDAEDDIRIAFDPRLADDPATWTFRLFLPLPDRRLAVAVRRLPGERVDVSLERFHFEL